MPTYIAGDVTKGREYQVVSEVLKEKLEKIASKAAEALNDLEESKKGDTAVRLANVGTNLSLIEDDLRAAKSTLRPFQQQLLKSMR